MRKALSRGDLFRLVGTDVRYDSTRLYPTLNPNHSVGDPNSPAPWVGIRSPGKT